MFNPIAGASADWIENFLRMVCTEGLPATDRHELEDQIEALVPALVELRDEGYIELSVMTLANFATTEGFMQLADDQRLTELSRQRCEAIRMRLVLQGVRALLGHLLTIKH